MAGIEHLVHSTKPDVIIGTETWLNSNITSQEIFKPEWDYTVYRKDRPDQSYGGVLIAVTNDLIDWLIDWLRLKKPFSLLKGITVLIQELNSPKGKEHNPHLNSHFPF